MKLRHAIAVGIFLCAVHARAQNPPASPAAPSFKFDFGSVPAAEGWILVAPDMLFDRERGFGFEPPSAGVTISGADQNGDDKLRGDFITGTGPFQFSVVVPEGNYLIKVTLGDAQAESLTTVKAEARRLMAERVNTAPGEFVTCTFIVSVRNPVLPDGRKIKLDVQEINPQGQLITPTWDDKLTLQFSDTRPAVAAVEIEPVSARPVTVFLMGDSTVTDQRVEPYGAWGQMLPRWFKPSVVVANYAESGETLKAFRAEGRWDKIVSQIRPGDYVFMQFGHNDLNRTGHNAIWPADDRAGDWENTYAEANTDYKRLLQEYAAEVTARGATPVIVSPMTKIDFRSGALNPQGLRDYSAAAVAAAKEADMACIDLHAMSVALVTALGPERARRAYVEGLHSNTYGAYLFARAIVEGIKQAKLPLSAHLTDDAGAFEPQNPQPLPDDFLLPLEPRPPRGAGRGRGRGPASDASASAAPASTTTAAPAIPANSTNAPAP